MQIHSWVPKIDTAVDNTVIMSQPAMIETTMYILGLEKDSK